MVPTPKAKPKVRFDSKRYISTYMQVKTGGIAHDGTETVG